MTNNDTRSIAFAAAMDGTAVAIAEQLKQTAFGEHNMLVYPSLTTFRNAYSIYAKFALEEGNEIVMLVPFYETTDSVEMNLHKNGIDAVEYLNNGSLIIQDSAKRYFAQGLSDTDFLLKRISNEVMELVKQAEYNNKSGVSIIADIGSFFHFGQLHELVAYETMLPQKFDNNIKAFCAYHLANFESMHNQQKYTLEHAHYRKVPEV